MRSKVNNGSPKRTIRASIPKGKDGINSKRKGANNERRAAAWLKNWTGREFNRTPASGGLKWLDSTRVAGDIVAPIDFLFPFVVEVKSRAKLTTNPKNSTELRKNSIFRRFWLQVRKDAEKLNKYPMLMARCNGMKSDAWYVGYPEYVKLVLDSLGIKPIFFYPGDNVCEKFYLYDSVSIISTDYYNFINTL